MAVPQIHRKKQNIQGTLEGQPEVTKMSLDELEQWLAWEPYIGIL